MKATNLKTITLACIVAMEIISCSSPKQKAENLENAKENLINAQDDLDKAVLDSTNEYDRYKIESEAKLKANDLKIAELKVKMKADKLEIRTKYEKQLNELEMKNAKLKTNIEDYKETDKNKWEIFKSNLNKEIEDIGKAITKMTEENQK
ncbi:MAG: hypothetical protein KBG33_08215 [Paludibacteraceae bacterium]|jgi:hypothetical protein|nr:hypothetical protein [Paludibacteraceae bacterium]